MKLYNIHKNKIEDLPYIDDNGIKYPLRMSDNQLNRIGYYRVEYRGVPNRKYYTFSETRKVQGSIYVIDYKTIDKPLDGVKSLMLHELKTQFTKESLRPRITTGLGYEVDGGRHDLENFTIGRKHNVTMITDADNNIHSVTDADYAKIIDAIEKKGMELMSMKWQRRDAINALPDVASCVAFEEVPFTFESISQKPGPLPIGAILLKDGLFDVTAVGNIISVRPGSGVIQRCPVCNRVIQKNTCRAHGSTESVQDMRIKAILDDGTGAVSVMLNRELSEIVYGRSMFEAEEIIRTAMSQDAVFEDMKRALTGKYIGVRGNSSRTEFGVTLVVESVWSPDDDIKVRVSNLLERLEPVGENING